MNLNTLFFRLFAQFSIFFLSPLYLYPQDIDKMNKKELISHITRLNSQVDSCKVLVRVSNDELSNCENRLKLVESDLTIITGKLISGKEKLDSIERALLSEQEISTNLSKELEETRIVVFNLNTKLSQQSTTLDSVNKQLLILLDKQNDQYEVSSEDRLRAESLLNEGVELIGNPNNKKENTLRAIEKYSNALIIDPTYADAFRRRAKAKEWLGNYQDALSDYKAAIDEDASNELSYFNRGDLYCQIGELEKAVSDFTSFIEIEPNYSRAYQHRGNCFAKQGNYEAAIKDYDFALTLPPFRGEKPDEDDILRASSLCKDLIKDYKGAIEDFTRLITRYERPERDHESGRKSLASFYVSRGLNYSKLNDLVSACTDFRRALELGSQDASTYIRQFCH
jgi:tetratricopeptide (TPR) repeat protein